MPERQTPVYNSRAVRLVQRVLADLAARPFQPRRNGCRRNGSWPPLYGVSRSTIRHTLELLVADRQLVREPRRGVKVPARPAARAPPTIPRSPGSPSPCPRTPMKLPAACMPPSTPRFHPRHLLRPRRHRPLRPTGEPRWRPRARPAWSSRATFPPAATPFHAAPPDGRRHPRGRHRRNDPGRHGL